MTSNVYAGAIGPSKIIYAALHKFEAVLTDYWAWDFSGLCLSSRVSQLCVREVRMPGNSIEGRSDAARLRVSERKQAFVPQLMADAGRRPSKVARANTSSADKIAVDRKGADRGSKGGKGDGGKGDEVAKATAATAQGKPGVQRGILLYKTGRGDTINGLYDRFKPAEGSGAEARPMGRKVFERAVVDGNKDVGFLGPEGNQLPTAATLKLPGVAYRPDDRESGNGDVLYTVGRGDTAVGLYDRFQPGGAGAPLPREAFVRDVLGGGGSRGPRGDWLIAGERVEVPGTLLPGPEPTGEPPAVVPQEPQNGADPAPRIPEGTGGESPAKPGDEKAPVPETGAGGPTGPAQPPVRPKSEKMPWFSWVYGITSGTKAPKEAQGGVFIIAPDGNPLNKEKSFLFLRIPRMGNPAGLPPQRTNGTVNQNGLRGLDPITRFLENRKLIETPKWGRGIAMTITPAGKVEFGHGGAQFIQPKGGFPTIDMFANIRGYADIQKPVASLNFGVVVSASQTASGVFKLAGAGLTETGVGAPVGGFLTGVGRGIDHFTENIADFRVGPGFRLDARWKQEDDGYNLEGVYFVNHRLWTPGFVNSAASGIVDQHGNLDEAALAAFPGAVAQEAGRSLESNLVPAGVRANPAYERVKDDAGDAAAWSGKAASKAAKAAGAYMSFSPLDWAYTKITGRDESLIGKVSDGMFDGTVRLITRGKSSADDVENRVAEGIGSWMTDRLEDRLPDTTPKLPQDAAALPVSPTKALRPAIATANET